MDYNAPAEVSWKGGRSRSPDTVRRKFFPHLWQAVRFVVGDKSELRKTCIIHSSGKIIEGEAIELLYAELDFPDRRSQPSSSPTLIDRILGRGQVKYRLVCGNSNSWAIYCIATDTPVEINGVRLTRMEHRQAEEMLRILNSPGEADMLALGP